MSNPPLPAGYMLDSDTPPLPAGYTLDKPSLMQRINDAINYKVPRPPGGGEEATLAEGAPVGEAGLQTIGLASVPVESIATKSLAPFLPLARGLVGSIAGRYLGREAGSMVGQPEAGAKVGEVALGIAGMRGKVPTKADIFDFLTKPEFKENGAPLPSADEFYANRGKDIIAAMKQQPEAFELPKIESSGGALPSTEEFYERRGREIMGAIKQQPEAFAQKRTTPFQGMTSTIPAEVQTMPVRSLPNTPAGSATGLPQASDLPKGNPTPFPAKFVSKFEQPAAESEPSRIVTPDTPPLPLNKTYVSHPRLLLVQKAKTGDMQALRELVRNPGNIDLDEAIPNWKFLIDKNAPAVMYGGPK